MNGIVVCVDFADLLALTLPRNAKHFDRIVVMTTYADVETFRVVSNVPNAEAHGTSVYYDNGAHFNKGLAVELALDIIGREGCLVIFDADIVMPSVLPLEKLSPGNLYSPRRRMCYDPKDWDGTEDWSKYRPYPEREYAGYFQLFHADDPVLAERPWYGVDWKTAAGCDSAFQARWPEDKRIRPDFEVLHLGPPAKNWCGRCTAKLDGKAVPEAPERKQALRRCYMLRSRRKDYSGEKIQKSDAGKDKH